MKSELPLFVNVLVYGSTLEFCLFLALVLLIILMSTLAIIKKNARHKFGHALAYMSGITFVLGFVSGSWGNLSLVYRTYVDGTFQANPLFGFMASLFKYSLLSVIALVGSFLTQLSRESSP